jgi:hypothetical protein
MKFVLNDKHSDIHTLIRELQAAEQNNRKAKGDTELRALLNRAAHTLNECESLMISAVNSLEEASRMKAGLMDSINRHDEIATAKNRAMTTTADFLKSKLHEYTPRTAAPATDEVI